MKCEVVYLIIEVKVIKIKRAARLITFMKDHDTVLVAVTCRASHTIHPYLADS